MSKTSDALRECNNHVLNTVKRLSRLAITVTTFVLLGSPPLPAHTLCFGCHFSLEIKIILRCDNQHSTTGTYYVDLWEQQKNVSRQKVFQGNYKMQLPLFSPFITHRAQVTWEST